MTARVARFRTGTKVGRTIYAIGDDGTEALVGMLDTPELAALFVEAVNRHIVETQKIGPAAP